MYLDRRSASNGSLSRGAVAGIAVGAVIFTVILSVGALTVWMRTRVKWTKHTQPTYVHPGITEYGIRARRNVRVAAKIERPRRLNRDDDGLKDINARPVHPTHDLEHYSGRVPQIQRPTAVHLHAQPTEDIKTTVSSQAPAEIPCSIPDIYHQPPMLTGRLHGSHSVQHERPRIENEELPPNDD